MDCKRTKKIEPTLSPDPLTPEAEVSSPNTKVREVILRSQDIQKLTPIISTFFNAHPVNAVVDTAAQVSVINLHLFEKIFGRDTKFERVNLKGAGTSHFMEAKFIKGQRIFIG